MSDVNFFKNYVMHPHFEHNFNAKLSFIDRFIKFYINYKIKENQACVNNEPARIKYNSLLTSYREDYPEFIRSLGSDKLNYVISSDIIQFNRNIREIFEILDVLGLDVNFNDFTNLINHLS